MPSQTEFSVRDGVLDISPGRFPGMQPDDAVALLPAVKSAFAQTRQFYSAFKPRYGGAAYRINRFAGSLSDKQLACVRAFYVANRLAGGYARLPEDAALWLFMQSAKVLNPDGLATIEYSANPPVTPFKPGSPEMLADMKGDPNKLWADTVENWGAGRDEGNPFSLWIFSPPPGQAAAGWAQSR